MDNADTDSLDHKQEAAEQALISILCRTMNRPELSRALESVCAQDYPNIELIIVDATGRQAIDSTTLPKQVNTVLVAEDVQLTRPAAANVALQHATGDYLLFLDEDDWIAQDHISALFALLTSDTNKLLAYSNVQKVAINGEPVDQVFSAEFNPDMLKRDNYIPIHAVLFSRRLLELGCRFDESFAIYEDWDFWMQCAQHSSFLHLNKLTAFYRQGGQSDTALTEEGSKYAADSAVAQARIAVLDKWLPRWNGADLNAMLGTMDTSRYTRKLEKQLEKERQQQQQALRQLDKVQGQLLQNQDQLADKEKQLTDKGKQLADKEMLLSDQQKLLADKDIQLLKQQSLITDKDMQLIDQQKLLADRDAQLIDRDTMLVDQQRQLADRDTLLTEKENQLADKEIQLVEQQTHHLQIQTELQDHIAELDSDLKSVLNSSSWRITKPYRWLGNQIKTNVITPIRRLFSRKS